MAKYRSTRLLPLGAPGEVAVRRSRSGFCRVRHRAESVPVAEMPDASNAPTMACSTVKDPPPGVVPNPRRRKENWPFAPIAYIAGIVDETPTAAAGVHSVRTMSLRFVTERAGDIETEREPLISEAAEGPRLCGDRGRCARGPRDDPGVALVTDAVLLLGELHSERSDSRGPGRVESALQRGRKPSYERASHERAIALDDRAGALAPHRGLDWLCASESETFPTPTVTGKRKSQRPF
jgi:hypothetical protein